MALNQAGHVQRVIKPKKPYFIGFNTVDNPTPPFNLTDIELVKRDILNQFQTPKGSRVMLPNFGSNIHQYLFDPFDEITKSAIIEDAVSVIESDPRVNLVSINVFQQEQAINILMDLLFVPQNITQSLFVTFNQTNQNSF